MLVTQFPKEMENDYSKINLKDTPATKRRRLMQIQPEPSPQSAHSGKRLLDSDTKAGGGGVGRGEAGR